MQALVTVLLRAGAALDLQTPLPTNNFSTAIRNLLAHKPRVLLLRREDLPSLPLTLLPIPTIRQKLETLALDFPGGKPRVLQSRLKAMWACINKQVCIKIYCAEVTLIYVFRVERGGCCFNNSQIQRVFTLSLLTPNSSHLPTPLSL